MASKEKIKVGSRVRYVGVPVRITRIMPGGFEARLLETVNGPAGMYRKGTRIYLTTEAVK